jgi:hypothetical protein
VGKPGGNRPLGRPRHRWEYGIRMDRRETGFRNVEWIQFGQDRDRWQALVHTVMNLQVLAPWNYLGTRRMCVKIKVVPYYMKLQNGLEFHLL